MFACRHSNGHVPSRGQVVTGNGGTVARGLNHSGTGRLEFSVSIERSVSQYGRWLIGQLNDKDFRMIDTFITSRFAII
jgi:hypothetical protein